MTCIYIATFYKVDTKDRFSTNFLELTPNGINAVVSLVFLIFRSKNKKKVAKRKKHGFENIKNYFNQLLAVQALESWSKYTK